MTGSVVVEPVQPGARRFGERLQTGLAALLYLLTAGALTWPMPFHPTTQLYGRGGDLFGAVGGMREIIDSGQIPFLPGTTPSLGAPEGAPITYATNVASWVGVGERWLSSLVFGPILGWNLIVLAGYVATGVATFLLVRKLSGSPAAALVAGWAYAFYPFAAANGAAHIEYAQGWLFILLVWRLLALREHASRRNALLAGGAMVVCFSYTGYFVIMGAVVVAAFYAVDLLTSLRSKTLGRRVRRQLLSTAPPLAALASYALIARGSAGEGLRVHPLSELYTYSARARFFLEPVPSSLLFGGRGTSYWATHNLGVSIGENGVYLGITVLLLAVSGLAFSLGRGVDAMQRAAVATFALLAVLGGAFSAPPTLQILGTTIHMPSWFVFQATSTWRVYSRFGMVVMLAVVLLAGFGLASLIRAGRGRSRALAGAVAVVAVVAVPLDLWSRREPAATTIPSYAYFRVLHDLRDAGIVAEYPLVAADVPSLTYVVTQDAINHPLFRGYAGDSSAEARALWLAPLDDPHTAARLALAQVRYVTLPDTPPGPDDPTPPAGRPAGTGLTVIDQSTDVDVFRVQARPAFAQAWPAVGFGRPEGVVGSRLAWLTDPGGTASLDIDARCSSCNGVLHFTTFSFAVPRTLTIKDRAGRVVLSTQVGTNPREVEVPLSGLRAGDPERYVVTVVPKPQSPRMTTGAADDRTLGVAIQEPDVKPAT